MEDTMDFWKEIVQDFNEYDCKDKMVDVLHLIYQYGGIDGSHHKQWLLNEIVRTLTGTEEKYNKWVDDYCQGPDGDLEYEWDKGIAP